jgi:hypothetical protein
VKLVSKSREGHISNAYTKWCYIHYSIVFLHYHITSFPEHFEDIERNQRTQMMVRAGEIWQALVELRSPWEHTLTQSHTILLYAMSCSLRLSKISNASLDMALLPLFHKRNFLSSCYTPAPKGRNLFFSTTEEGGWQTLGCFTRNRKLVFHLWPSIFGERNLSFSWNS